MLFPANRSSLVPSAPTLSPTILVLRTVTQDTETTIDVFRQGDPTEAPLTSIPARTPQPQLPVSDSSVEHIQALDVLEAVLDEEAWLEAMVLALAPGGTAT